MNRPPFPTAGSGSSSLHPSKSSASASSSAARERRAGGYGGFYDNNGSTSSLQSGEQQQQQQGYRPGSSRSRGYEYEQGYERRDEKQYEGETGPVWGGGGGSGRSGRDERGYGDVGRSREREREREREMGKGTGLGAQSVDEILRMIHQEWDFMANDDCVPVQVGLQLMDSSTLGQAEREPDFIYTHKQIQKSLRSIVNEHHQGFNSSIGTYHTIQSSIQSSQNRIRMLKGALTEAKSGLLTTKPELKGLATASQNYDDILQLFGQIENIGSLPEKLEARISEKRFIAAVEILQDALRLVHRPELETIGGLGDLRTYFSNQEISLTDILVEELHDHLYLKSPYCHDRWKTANGDDGKDAMGANGGTNWEKPIYHFLSTLDVTTPLTEDASRNPEADTFYYIRVIIEALNKMGNLEVAVDRIEQRLPVELFGVVDKTSSEVAARHPDHGRSSHARDSRAPGVPAGLGGERGQVLAEFMWTLFAKFEAIAEGHRVVHDVVAGIVEREGIRKGASLTSGFKELWKLYQSEIRSLLHDYLATDGESTYRSAANVSNDAYTLATIKRDKTKRMFKLSEVDQKSSDMKAEQDELDEILRSSVPGLVSKSRQKASATNSSRSRQESSGTGHKLLIEPSVFNMSLLLPPSLAFIHRLKDIVPFNSDIMLSTLTSFLDDFLINVFQPQLDEAVTDLCAMTFIALDAFTEDPQWSRVSPRPIFRGTIAFMELVKTFSRMLDSIPHDQAFTQLVISQIVTYYDKCCGWYKALVMRMSPQQVGGVQLKAAAAYAESGEIRETAKELWEHPDNKRHELITKEIDLLIAETNETPLEPYDIVSDPKTVFSLSLLYNSMQWLVSNLSLLRHITTHQTDSSRSQSNRASHTRRWTLLSNLKSNRNRDSTDDTPTHLPMTKESVIAFDKTLQSLQNLALTSLLTLHIDIRCGAIHMVTRSLSGNHTKQYNQHKHHHLSTPPATSQTHHHPHLLPTPPSTASPLILDLNNDLISFDANIATYLSPRECRYITSGLAQLIDRAFVSATRFIGVMNTNGALRLQLDVLVLQQNLRNVILPSTTTATGKGLVPGITTQTQPDPSSSSSSTGLGLGLQSQPDTQPQPQPQPPPDEDDEPIALPRSAKFLDWFLEGAEKAVENARVEREEWKRHGALAAAAAGNGEPFSYEEVRVLVELCFSAGGRGEEEDGGNGNGNGNGGEYGGGNGRQSMGVEEVLGRLGGVMGGG
ncbi:hypothetical protein FQN55_000467 [Onygenales sp. PD_40]|nr:hypothetical protein FQN55_000467 [Onygenales sp. PD_40]